MKLSILILVAAILPLAASAGGNVENGGVGVISGNTIYTLELVERGVELNPHLEGESATDPELSSLLDTFLRGRGVERDTVAILERKLTRIKRSYSRILLPGIRKALETYNLVLINAPLRTIRDRLSPIDERVLAQIAVHGDDNRLIQVNREAFAKMNPANQAALLLHELIYASTKDKTSRPSRQVNGLLFDPAAASDDHLVRYEITLARKWGEMCIHWPENAVCKPGHSSPEVIHHAQLVQEYIEAYSQPMPAEVLRSGREFTWLQSHGPSFEKKTNWGEVKSGVVITFYPKNSDFYISTASLEADSEFVKENRQGLKSATSFQSMAGDKHYPRESSWSDRVGKMSTDGRKIRGRTRNQKASAELSLIRLPNGKFFYAAHFQQAALSGKYAYALGVLGATR